MKIIKMWKSKGCWVGLVRKPKQRGVFQVTICDSSKNYYEAKESADRLSNDRLASTPINP